jgi:hypothetical protein
MRHLAAVVCLALSACGAYAATFTVTTSADSGPGSLRDAILGANTSTPPNDIRFTLSPSRIVPLSPLPALTNSMTLDGTNHPVYISAPVVILDGQYGATNGPGLQVNGTGIVVRALRLVGFTGTAVQVQGSHNAIEGCHVVSNLQYGIHVLGSSNRIGGVSNALRNMVYGNPRGGVVITNGVGNTVRANLVGVNIFGFGSSGRGEPPQERGIWLSGGRETLLEGWTGGVLVVSGNGVGVEFGPATYSNTLRGAWFSVDAEGTGSVPNADAIIIHGPSHGNVLGGAFDTQRNVVGANSNRAVQLLAGSSNNVIRSLLVGFHPLFTALYTNQYGLLLSNSAGNVVGAPGDSNFIVGCSTAGLQLSGTGATHNLIQHTIAGAGPGFLSQARNYETLVLEGAPANQVGPGNALVLSSNHGVRISGRAAADNLLIGNFIGVNPLGQQQPNLGHGVYLQQVPGTLLGDGSVTGRNTIGGNFGYGVVLEGTGTFNTLMGGNWIGVAGTPPQSRTNRMGGVWLNDAPSNTIGIAGDAPNVISGNDGAGIRVSGAPAWRNLIVNNFIGLDPAGTGSLFNTSHGIQLAQARATRIGGTVAGERNVIGGNQGYGILVEAGETYSNLIAGNFIGSRSNGFAAVSNTLGGVRIESWGTQVGGAATNARNVIAGNGGSGLLISGAEASNTVVLNNYLGIMAGGQAASPNGGDGVRVAAGASATTIGGAGSGNLIGGNGQNGVFITGSSTRQARVSGNLIGTYADGTNGGGRNAQFGVRVSQANDHVIGGTNVGEGNLICANLHGGILVETSALVRIWGNRIGADATGYGPLGNASNGVLLRATADAIVGGAGPYAGNQVADHDQFGVWILLSTGAMVRGNLIGTAADGLQNLGNAGHGVLVSGVSNSIVGNRIAWAKNPSSDGVSVSLGSAFALALDNVVFSNGTFNGQAVDLEDDGPTPNDPAPDADGGANLRQNYPQITNAAQEGATVLAGYLSSSNSTTYTVQFFASDVPQGGVFLGTTSVTTSASGTGVFLVSYAYLLPTGALLHATATDPQGRTSEYSPGVTNRAGTDSDGDGLPDLWEQQHFGTLTNGAAGNVDGDTYDNLSEYIADTQPTNAASFFELYGIARSGDATGVQILPSAPGRFHHLEYHTNLAGNASWTSLGAPQAGDGGLLVVTDGDTNRHRAYRVQITLP